MASSHGLFSEILFFSNHVFILTLTLFSFKSLLIVFSYFLNLQRCMLIIFILYECNSCQDGYYRTDNKRSQIQSSNIYWQVYLHNAQYPITTMLWPSSSDLWPSALPKDHRDSTNFTNRQRQTADTDVTPQTIFLSRYSHHRLDNAKGYRQWHTARNSRRCIVFRIV